MLPRIASPFLLGLVLVAAGALSALAADEVHWTLTGPTSVTLDWRGGGALVRYGFTTNYAYSGIGRVPVPYPFSSLGSFYEARLGNLIPGVTYHYSISGGPDHVFRTAPPVGTPFTIFVEADIGDAQTYPNVAAVQSLIADGHPDWVLCAGDLTYGDDHGQAAVDRHFNDVMTWSQDAAYMPAWGNHEWANPTDDLRNYKGRFELPNAQASPGAPAAGGFGEDWYWFDYAGVRFIAYPEPYPGAWADWLPRATALMDAAQSDTTLLLIVTFGHRPAYSSGEHAGEPEIRAELDSLGSHHSKYVLNLNGHSHDYERSTSEHGVTHVTVGIGGSMMEQQSDPCLWLGGCPAPSWSAFRAFHHGALRLRFDGSRIHGDAICGPAGDVGGSHDDITCAPGDAFDSFTLGMDNAPVISVPARQSGSPSIPIVVRVTAHDPDGDPIQSLTADLSRLPPEDGATFQADPGDTSGTMSWTPDADDTSTYVVVFHAQNSLSATASTVLRVPGTLDSSTLAGFALESAWPNPSRRDVDIVYRVPDDRPVRLDVTDAAGRVVTSCDLGLPGPGRHTYSLGRLPARAGIYWLRLSQAAHTQVMKIALLR